MRKAANTPIVMNKKAEQIMTSSLCRPAKYPVILPKVHGAATIVRAKGHDFGKKKRSSVTMGTFTGAFSGTCVCATSRNDSAQGMSVHQYPFENGKIRWSI